MTRDAFLSALVLLKWKQIIFYPDIIEYRTTNTNPELSVIIINNKIKIYKTRSKPVKINQELETYSAYDKTLEYIINNE